MGKAVIKPNLAVCAVVCLHVSNYLSMQPSFFFYTVENAKHDGCVGRLSWLLLSPKCATPPGNIPGGIPGGDDTPALHAMGT